MDSKGVITRFEQERQTLAVMNHQTSCTSGALKVMRSVIPLGQCETEGLRRWPAASSSADRSLLICSKRR
jgi:hypothetical protein